RNHCDHDDGRRRRSNRDRDARGQIARAPSNRKRGRAGPDGSASRRGRCAMSAAPRTVTREEWIAARRAFLEREKAFDRKRDALPVARRALPRVKVDKPYIFHEPSGERTLLDLFDAQPQLIVYHFMLAPGASDGCPGCSYVADNIEGGWRHFAGRDTAFA